MILICLTGKKGSGKSTLLNKINNIKLDYLKTFSADDFIHSIYRKGKVGYVHLNNTFGPKYNDENGINRNLLSKDVFEDKNIYNSLIVITNPLIKKWIKEISINYSNSSIVIIELAIYLKFEKYFIDCFDKVIFLKSFDNNNSNHVSQFLNDDTIKFDFSINGNEKKNRRKNN